MSKKKRLYCEMTPLEACTHAAQLVRKAGFQFSHAALNGSTSTYYKFPGRIGLLRISTHSTSKPKNRRQFGPAHNVASLTFSHKAVFADGMLIMKVLTIEAETASAIGRFFLTAPHEQATEDATTLQSR